MRREHKRVDALFGLLVGIGSTTSSCAGSSTGGETTNTDQTSSSAPTTTATNSSGVQTTTSSTSSSTAQGATGTSGTSTTTGPSGGTATSQDTGSSGGSGAATSSSASGSSASNVGPTGSEDNETSAPTSGSEMTASDSSASSDSDTSSETPDEPDLPGECNESEGTGRNASGTGPHDVVIETNASDGIRCGTIYRPAELKGAEKYPILVWGEGGCSQDGLSNQAAMAEIASWGYFVVADGTPGGNNACQSRQNGAAFLDYVSWAMDENRKPCSAYYHSLDTTKIAADGFSCGGLMAENVAGDPRFTAIGITSSGLMGANNALWDSMHAPFKIMNGGSSDVAYQNGLNDYDAISMRGIPILYFSQKSAGHGGDLGQGRGNFNLVNLAWLNWQLKGDEGQTGKAFLIGPTCEFCSDGGWDFKSANID